MKYFLTLLCFLIPVAWSTYVNANYVTAKTFLLFLVSSLALLALPDQLKLRKVPRALVVLGGLLLGYQIVFYAVDPSYFNLLSSFKTLSFLFLLLYFYTLDLSVEEFLRKNTLLIGSVFGFILVITFRQIVSRYQGGSDLIYGNILSTFGNVNMFSEFVILCLPFLFLWQRNEDGIFRVLKLGFFALFVFLLLFCSSRSAWMGLGLFLLAKLYFRMQKKEWVAVGVGVVLYVAAQFGVQSAGQVLQSKGTSGAERMLIYKSSVRLLADTPFGIEVGRYLSDVVPYLHHVTDTVNESSYYDQPHSELLKWGIQFGWIYLVLAAAALLFLLWYLFRRVRSERKSADGVFFEFLLVLAPQVVFQFPFENPASLLVLAFVGGMFLAQFEFGRAFDISKIKLLTSALAVAGLINGFLYISAVYVVSNYSRSSDMMRLACSVYPAYFQSCYWKHVNDLENKRLDRFRLTYKKDFSRLPFHPDHLRILIPYFNAAGERVRMCEAAKIYNHLYRGQKSVSADMIEFCRDQYPPFDLDNTAGFRDNYLRWLNQ